MQDVVAELRVDLKDLAAEDRAGWVPLALSDRVRDLVGLTEAMQVELVRGLAGWDRATAWVEDGAVTAVAWLKANTILTGPEAAGLVRLARLYAQHRVVAAALDGGDLTLAKARLLARAEKNREALFAECVPGFVELAAVLGNIDFGQVIDQWIDLVDDKPPPDDAKRRWTSADTIGGSAHTDMFGPADDAALMRAAIEALDTPDPVDCPEGPRAVSSGTTTSSSTCSGGPWPTNSETTSPPPPAPTSSWMPPPPPTWSPIPTRAGSISNTPCWTSCNPSTSPPPGTGSSAAAASTLTAPRSGGRWPRPPCATAGSAASSPTPTPATSSTSAGPTAASPPANAAP